MPRTPSAYRTTHRQAGAALIVGLLLLLVLTVLAVSGMNTTSLNLIMAGNTQYSQNAFQAAESGIERAIAKNQFNPDPTLAAETDTDVVVSRTADGRQLAKYTAISTVKLGGDPQEALPGSSLAAYDTYHFEIDSTGTSSRDATARNVQAIAILAKAGDTWSSIPGGTPGSNALE